MYLFKKVSDYQRWLRQVRDQGATIGFFPTMGALHQGHLSLFETSKKENDRTVCSIFVNPTQFNDPKDLEKYPRIPGKDIEMLATAGVDVLFIPDVSEIYPKNLTFDVPIDLGHLDQVLEGSFRPGHFKGVVQVVKRLLDIIQPDSLYMGQKDFQQLTIIRHMMEQLNLAIKLVACPTVREKDGLAMSSRNVRIEPAHRPLAPLIFQALTAAKESAGILKPEQIKATATAQINQPPFKVEYFEIVDGQTLLPVKRFQDAETVIACTAVWLGAVRLIDNLIVKAPDQD